MDSEYVARHREMRPRWKDSRRQSASDKYPSSRNPTRRLRVSLILSECKSLDGFSMDVIFFFLLYSYWQAYYFLLYFLFRTNLHANERWKL
jgi:hypothetical protein